MSPQSPDSGKGRQAGLVVGAGFAFGQPRPPGGRRTQSVEKTYPEFVKKPDDVNAKLSVLWMGVGDDDPLATAGMRKSDAEMTKYGIKHVFRETAGAHEFSVWRWCLVQFAPLLFQK